MENSNMAGATRRGWWVRNAPTMKSLIRVVFGLIWVIDGALKFSSGFVDSFAGAVQTAAGNAPGWLSGWYAFWIPQASAHPALIVDTVGILELALGTALLLGLARKLAYVGGAVLSLLIWAVPEGFGGPYGPGTGGTDVGTGAIYALVFLALVVINASQGPSRLSLDFYLERKLPSWAWIAEFGGPAAGVARPPDDVPPARPGSV